MTRFRTLAMVASVALALVLFGCGSGTGDASSARLVARSIGQADSAGR